MLIVMEHMAGGDLQQFVKAKGHLSEGEARQVFHQIVEGVAVIHRNRILHRDLKLDNILLDAKYSKVKLCDFGICKVIKRGQVITDKSGTPAYVAPEVIAGQGYEGYASDVWSLGVLLYALLVGTFPFLAENLTDLNKVILTGAYQPPPSSVSASGKELISLMLTLMPSRRIKVKEILKHRWFSETESASPKPPVFAASGSEGEMSPILDDSFIRRMESLGWPRSVLMESLRNSELDYGTAGYRLLKAASHCL
jgi:serine/threonine protein kinase